MWSQILRELGSLVSKSPNSGMCGLEPWTAVNTLWPIISSDKFTVMRNSNKTQKDNALHSTRVFPQCQSLLVTHAATQATDVLLRFQLSLSTFSGNKIFLLLHIFENFRVFFCKRGILCKYIFAPWIELWVGHSKLGNFIGLCASVYCGRSHFYNLHICIWGKPAAPYTNIAFFNIVKKGAGIKLMSKKYKFRKGILT